VSLDDEVPLERGHQKGVPLKTLFCWYWFL